MDHDEEFTPYKKRSAKKPPAKARHKHDFHPCVFEYDYKTYDKNRGYIYAPDVMFGSYCILCGKIGSAPSDLDRMVMSNSGKPKAFRPEYSDEAKRQLDSTTRTLPTFWLDDWLGQKFVELKEDV